MVVVRSTAATEKEYGGGVGGYIGNNYGVCGGGGGSRSGGGQRWAVDDFLVGSEWRFGMAKNRG